MDPTPPPGKLIASDGAASDYFGLAVAIDSDRAVVGAPLADDSGVYAGAAYIYERSGTGVWVETTELLAAAVASADRFGISVAIDGERAVVGAYGDDDSGPDAGAAYVFERSGTGDWVETDKLLAVGGEATDYFGYTVAIDGDRVVVGAFGADAAYVFERGGTGVWVETDKLVASDGTASDEFGSSVAIEGDRVVVGNDGDDDNGLNSGSAYVYVRDISGDWVETDKTPCL